MQWKHKISRFGFFGSVKVTLAEPKTDARREKCNSEDQGMAAKCILPEAGKPKWKFVLKHLECNDD